MREDPEAGPHDDRTDGRVVPADRRTVTRRSRLAIGCRPG
jgi:hypothetical protein